MNRARAGGNVRAIGACFRTNNTVTLNAVLHKYTSRRSSWLSPNEYRLFQRNPVMHSLTSSFPLPLQVKCWTRTCATTSVCSFRRARWTTSSSRSYGTTSTCAPSHVSCCTAAFAAVVRPQHHRFVSLFEHLVEKLLRASHSWKRNALRGSAMFFPACLHIDTDGHRRTKTYWLLFPRIVLLPSFCLTFYKTLTHKMSPWQPHQGHLSNPHVTYLVLSGIIALIKVIFPL